MSSVMNFQTFERLLDYAKWGSPADKNNFNSLTELFRENKWEEAFEFIQAHKEVATMVGHNQHTALHNACRYGAPLRIINILIELNPLATKAKNHLGDLPLHNLFWSHADPAVVQRLLEVDPSAAKVQNNEGYLPLHQAAKNVGDGQLPLLLSLLMQANPAAVSTHDNRGRYPFHVMMEHIVYQVNPENMRGVDIVLDATSDVVSTPRPFFNGGLPLHFFFDHPPSTASFSDLWPELVGALIKAYPGALIFANNDRLVPLHIAVKKWPFDEELAYDEDEELLDNPPPADELTEFHCQLIETLIKANPDTASIPDSEGRLALHLACKFWPCNVTERLSVLLAANMNALNLVDSHGKTPLQYAFERESDAHEFIAGLFSATKQVQLQKFQHTIMANEGLSVGLAGTRKGLDEERQKNRLLEEENAKLKAENTQLRS